MLRTKLVAPAIEWQRKLRVTETEKTFRVDSTRVIKKSAIQSTLFRAIGFVKNPEATIIDGHDWALRILAGTQGGSSFIGEQAAARLRRRF